MAKKTDYKYDYLMSKDCRRSKAKQTAVLAWIKSKKEYAQTGRAPTPEEFIKEALKPGSKLYKANVLEHNQRKAAEMYWYYEAQYYLRHVNVVRTNIKTFVASPPVRAYIPVEFSYGGRVKEYATANRVASNEGLAESILDRAYKDLLAWSYRYERYSEFLKEFDSVLVAIKTLPRVKPPKKSA